MQQIEICKSFYDLQIYRFESEQQIITLKWDFRLEMITFMADADQRKRGFGYSDDKCCTCVVTLKLNGWT